MGKKWLKDVDHWEIDAGNEEVILFNEDGNEVDTLDINSLVEEWLDENKPKSRRKLKEVV